MSKLKKKVFFYLAIVFTASFIINTFRNVIRYSKLENDLAAKQEELNELLAKNNELKKDLVSFNSKNMESLIRNKLSMAKEGETIIIIPEELVAPINGMEADEVKPADRPENWQKWLSLFF